MLYELWLRRKNKLANRARDQAAQGFQKDQARLCCSVQSLLIWTCSTASYALATRLLLSNPDTWSNSNPDAPSVLEIFLAYGCLAAQVVREGLIVSE